MLSSVYMMSIKSDDKRKYCCKMHWILVLSKLCSNVVLCLDYSHLDYNIRMRQRGNSAAKRTAEPNLKRSKGQTEPDFNYFRQH